MRKINNSQEKKCCLHIGNTRWHWAFQDNKKWRYVSTAPNASKLNNGEYFLWKWAAVGPIPKDMILEAAKCIKTSDIPLFNLPKWIGIDRALAAWYAFSKAKSQNIHSQGIMVADAGTILSITLVTANGEFAGGQLAPG